MASRYRGCARRRSPRTARPSSPASWPAGSPTRLSAMAGRSRRAPRQPRSRLGWSVPGTARSARGPWSGPPRPTPARCAGKPGESRRCTHMWSPPSRSRRRRGGRPAGPGVLPGSSSASCSPTCSGRPTSGWSSAAGRSGTGTARSLIPKTRGCGGPCMTRSVTCSPRSPERRSPTAGAACSAPTATSSPGSAMTGKPGSPRRAVTSATASRSPTWRAARSPR
jgi:hypothetical protein